MSKRNKDLKSKVKNASNDNFYLAERIIREHIIFGVIPGYIIRSANTPYPQDGYARVNADGYIYVNPKRYAEVDEWVYVLAHCLLHIGLGHFQVKPYQKLWNIACDVFIAKFLDDLKFGKMPSNFTGAIPSFSNYTEEQLYENFVERGFTYQGSGFGAGNPDEADMIPGRDRSYIGRDNAQWRKKIQLWPC